MKRRNFLLASTGLLLGGWLLKPNDKGAPHSDYFSHLNTVLRENRIARPLLILDREKLKQNCTTLIQNIAPNKNFRIVAKSLPSIPLLGEIMSLTHTHRIMTFHQPFTNAVALAYPQSDILLGKPLPVDAAENFYLLHPTQSNFIPDLQLQWLIDSAERLHQYLALAQKLDKKLQINIELDVGLHRGGLKTFEQLNECLTLISQHSKYLRFSGFMGYDAHVGKLPSFIESADTSLRKAQMVYAGFIDHLRNQFSALYHDELTFNGAGSPTFFLHDERSPLNELSAGSCLVKPTDFDLPSLSQFVPAAFIASPIIKSQPGVEIPGPLPIGDAWALWDVNRRHTFFIYGGNWLAKPESPAGMQRNSLYGVSSNQMMFNESAAYGLQANDFVFFRPTQSESVLLQFGDIAALDADGIVNWWAPLEQGHGY
ncbi:MAG: alanine racemase [Alcanivoracaceae bacterium]|nr:alanine racemase [Alcanivoracaceae bacterium]